MSAGVPRPLSLWSAHGARPAPGADDAGILHADLDSFFAAVEQRDDPTLRGRPVIVGGGVVLAASYEAKASGVRTAMSGSAARRLCPAGIVVPPRMSAYSEASKAVFAIFDEFSSRVEAMSIDEAFLDVRGRARHTGTPLAIAARLRRRVHEAAGLPVTVGIARTKFLAKVASAAAKPAGLLLVPPSGERDFLYPLPVRRMWGVGAVTAAKLAALGIMTVGQLAAAGEPTISSALGQGAGRHLYLLTQGLDARPVQPARRRSSMGAQRALGRGRHPAADVDAALMILVERVAGRMRSSGRAGRTITIRLRFDDFTRATRSRSLREPTATTAPILREARRLLAAAGPTIVDRGGLTLIGVAISGFNGADEQPELPFGRGGGAALDETLIDAAVDAVRERFGATAMTRAGLLGRSTGVVMPMLPD